MAFFLTDAEWNSTWQKKAMLMNGLEEINFVKSWFNILCLNRMKEFLILYLQLSWDLFQIKLQCPPQRKHWEESLHLTDTIPIPSSVFLVLAEPFRTWFLSVLLCSSIKNGSEVLVAEGLFHTLVHFVDADMSRADVWGTNNKISGWIYNGYFCIYWLAKRKKKLNRGEALHLSVVLNEAKYRRMLRK